MSGQCRPARLSYPGVTLIHRRGDFVVGEAWVPVGDEPTFTDDEVLIDALRAAWCWTKEAV
ncbi:hypothetical protein AVL48_14515 [Amycolatopsis regifaucium]|uniref:Uncharacterized protein n=1 Tax=Amycolatopsis regifaucium TaxID=546365 RepID=A0A154M5J7_9PSEU|nr:hypothetical protein AVL48_14515 [Amycolatopsis regifaucium]OKA10091.1 hypothetical protein ATP06_0206900 [Amycolatopsis regifaucium]